MAFVKGQKKTGGRKKGSLNKENKQLREMILTALDKAGGEEYLQKQADKNPTSFMTLLGKVMPTQLTGEGGGSITVSLDLKDKDA